MLERRNILAHFNASSQSQLHDSNAMGYNFQPVVEEKVQPVEITPEQSEKPLEEDLSWEDKGEKIGDEIKVEKENDTGIVP